MNRRIVDARLDRKNPRPSSDQQPISSALVSCTRSEPIPGDRFSSSVVQSLPHVRNFFGRNPKTQAVYFAIAAPASKFHLQFNVAVLVDLLKGVIQGPLFDVRPSFKRCLLHELPGFVPNVFQAQNFAQGCQAHAPESDLDVLLRPLIEPARVLAFEPYSGLPQALL